jgi:glycosyltransferase involved in cell wall biosynthesis
MDKINVSIVSPAYNEETAVSETVSLIRDVCSRCAFIDKYEIIVVDDGSTDGTLVRAEEAGARVITHLSNSGYGKSLKDGILAAEYDTIVITDSDATYPVDQIPALLEQYRRGFDLVVGARQKDSYRESFLKSVLRIILRFLVGFATGVRIPDVNSGLRVFSRDTVITYFNHLCNSFSFTSSQTLAYLLTSRYVCYVPIEYRERAGKSKVSLFRDMLRTLQYIVFQILYYNPIKLFLILIGFFMILALLAFLFSLVTGIALGYFLGLICIINCGLLLALGLLSEQLRQLMMSDDDK